MTKSYQELVKDRIFIGSADDIYDVIENENVDVAFDLRAEAFKKETTFNWIHSPIVDEATAQEVSIKKSIDQVIDAYHAGKNVYFHCQGGSNRTGTVAIGTLLELGKARSIDEAEKIANEVRPKIKVKPEMKEALKKIYPHA